MTKSLSYQARFALSGGNEVLAIVRDTTRQKATDSSKERLDTILDAILDPVVTTTRGEIRYINPAARVLLGIHEPRRFRVSSPSSRTNSKCWGLFSTKTCASASTH